MQGSGTRSLTKTARSRWRKQIPREALGNTQRRIETARAYYLAEHQDEPVGKIQNVAVTTLEKFRSGVRKRRNLAPRSLPENDVRFIDPQYNELFRVPDGSVVQMTYPDGTSVPRRSNISMTIT